MSGRVRDAFLRRGHDAISCDLLQTQTPGPHLQIDIFEAIDRVRPTALIVFPPCTYLCSSGLHWNTRLPERQLLTDQALAFTQRLFDADVHFFALENPVGRISTAIRPPDQTIQPHMFGEDASKKTCLWLKNLPPLRPTRSVPPRLVCCNHTLTSSVCGVCFGTKTPSKRWANQTDSGQDRRTPSPDRGIIRSLTYPGIAEAMAEQWGPVIAGS